MEAWRSQSLPPLLSIPHEQKHRQPAHQQHERECRPRPAVADPLGQLQPEEADHERKAAGEVEERAAFGRLRLVAVAHVSVDTRRVDLEAETA